MKSFAQLYNEIKEKELEPLEEPLSQDPSERPLNYIFGNKLRVVIPLTNSPTAEFQRELEATGVRADLKTGMAYSKVQTQQGEKERAQRIGSFLATLAKKDPKYAKLLQFWEKNKTGIGRQDDTQGVSVVISRSPLDLVRMSDFDEWSSCHGVGESYFHCAIQEAKTGGAIAYVVRNSDIQSIPNLQAQDIFKDEDRNIEGIEPLERIRLRRFSNGEHDLILPEKRTYGIKHTGFAEAVTSWAKHAQQKVIDTKPDFKEYDLYGGSYQDNRADTIWNNFFGTEVSGSKKSKNARDQGRMSADEMDEQAQEQIANHKYKHWQVWIDVQEDDGRAYLFMNAGCCYEFSSDIFEQIPTEKEMRTWSPENNKQISFGKHLKEVLRDKDVYIENDVVVNENGANVSFCVDHESHDHSSDLDGLEHFLDEIDNLDKKYNEHTQVVYEALVQYGFVKQEHAETPTFQHMKVDPEDGEITAQEIWIGDLDGLPQDAYTINPYTRGKVNALVLRDDIQKAVDQQMKLAMMVDADFHFSFMVQRGLSKNIIGGSQDPNASHQKVFMYASGELTSPIERTKQIASLRQIDQNWDFLCKKLAIVWHNIKMKITHVTGAYQHMKAPPKMPQPSSNPAVQKQLPFTPTNEFRQFFYR